MTLFVMELEHSQYKLYAAAVSFPGQPPECFSCMLFSIAWWCKAICTCRENKCLACPLTTKRKRKPHRNQLGHAGRKGVIDLYFEGNVVIATV